MVELTTQERLQPSLLDRLTDHTRFRERLTLIMNEAALENAGLTGEALRRLFELHELERVEHDAGAGGAGPAVEVYEGRPGARVIRRLLEHRIETAGAASLPVSALIEIRDRRRVPNTAESRRERVISGRQLKEFVLRDLSWLLNTGNLASVQELDGHPRVQSSVLNYGIPDLAGATASSADAEGLAAAIRRAIETFEPRLRQVRITPVAEDDAYGGNALSFMIEAELWGQPTSEHLVLHTELDLESADVTVREAGTGGG